MAKQGVSNFNFAAGILAPEIQGDLELSKQALGLADASNIFITPSGTVSNKAGTEFLDRTKDDGIVRLIKFVFNKEQSYNLEFGDEYIRFYRDGALLTDGGSPVEVVTTYDVNDIKDIRYTQSADVLYLTHPSYPAKKLVRNTDIDWSLIDLEFTPPVSDVAFALTVAGVPSPTVQFDWEYTVTVVNKSGREGTPVATQVQVADIELNDQPITVTVTAPVDVSDVKEYRIYRKEGIYFFLVGLKTEDGSPNYVLKDGGLTPDLTVSTPEPFDNFNAVDKYPITCGLYNDRLIFGGTNDNPNTLYFSRIGDYENFTNTPVLAEDEAITRTLSSGEVNRIQHLTTFDDLLCFTEANVWRVKGTSNLNLTAFIESASGSSRIDPVKTKKSILFVESNENTVSDFIYQQEVAGYDGSRLDVLSRNLFRDFSIVDFDFSSSPNGVLFCVRDDGKMLVMTYLKSQDIFAWSVYETDGEYEGIVVLQKDKYDEIYVVVKRENGRFIELFKQELGESQGVEESWYLDSALQYNGNKTNTLQIIDSDAISSESAFQLSNVGDLIKIPNIDPLKDDDEYEILAFVDEFTVTIDADDQTVTEWALVVDEFSNLDHLEGMEVNALCDGNVEKGMVVTDGKITIEDKCAIVTVGLGYDCFIQTVNYDTISSKGGSTIPLMRNFVKAIFGVHKSRGWRWKTASADDWIDEKDQDGLRLGEELGLRSGKIPIDLLTTTGLSDNLYIGTNNPLPLKILNLTVVIKYGENI